jgi:DNA-binding GntR family transcriptional regulator
MGKRLRPSDQTVPSRERSAIPTVQLVPAARKRLYELVIERLQSFISATRMGPGDRLPPERDLAIQLGVSRTSVRQALVALEVEGILQVRHGDGTYLTSIDGRLSPFEALLTKQDRLPELLATRATSEVNRRLHNSDDNSLRTRTRRLIRSSIAAGQIEPGRIYPISFLTSWLGVSATPVREALRDLDNEGLIDILKNRGFLIPNLTDSDLDEIAQLRLMLEVPAHVMAVGKLSPEDTLRCEGLVDQVLEHAKEGNLASFLDYDRSFHLGIIEAAGNKRVTLLVSRLRDRTRLPGLPELTTSGRLIAAAEEHRAILTALTEGNRALLRQLITRHLRHTRGVWAGRGEADDSLERSGEGL